MAVKSIVDIEVNDEKFKAFAANFAKYTDALAKTPSVWKDAGVHVESEAKLFATIAAALFAQHELTKKVSTETEKTKTAASGAARHWQNVSRWTKETAGHIKAATEQLLRWAKLSTIFTGLLGAGGLFGIDRLALAATSQRRNAAGLGISVGQQQSFALNFGRFVDPGATLGNIAGGLYDVTSPQYRALLAAGISPNLLRGGNAADVGAALLGRLPQLFGHTPKALLGSQLHAYGLDQIISQEDVLRYLNASPEERAKQQGSYRKDANDLNLIPAQLRAWNDLHTQLERAGKMIEKAFIVGLTPLAGDEGPIAKLSQAFSGLVTSLLKSDGFQWALGKVAEGLMSIADYIGKPEFKQDLKDVADGIKALALGVVEALKVLGIVPRGKDEPPPADDDLSPSAGLRRMRKRWDELRNRPPGVTPTELNQLPRGIGMNGGVFDDYVAPDSAAKKSAYRTGGGVSSGAGGAVDYFVKAGWSQAQAAGIVANLQTESGLNPRARGDGGAAIGAGQWHPDRQANFRRVFGHDISQSTLEEQLAFVNWELTHTESRTGKLLRGARSAKEAGGIISRFYERPRDVAGEAGRRGDLADRIMKRLDQRGLSRGVGKKPHIVIQNNTGGSATVIAPLMAV